MLCHNILVSLTKLLQICPSGLSDHNGCNNLRQHQLHISKMAKHRKRNKRFLVQCLLGNLLTFLHTNYFHPTQLGKALPNNVWLPSSLDLGTLTDSDLPRLFKACILLEKVLPEINLWNLLCLYKIIMVTSDRQWHQMHHLHLREGCGYATSF